MVLVDVGVDNLEMHKTCMLLIQNVLLFMWLRIPFLSPYLRFFYCMVGHFCMVQNFVILWII